MSRYVDAEYCEDFFDRWESRVKNAEPVTIDVVQNTRTLLREAPFIDLVCCEECRYTDGNPPIADGRLWCKKHNSFMYYCSDGERTNDGKYDNRRL